jgi:phosphonate transport system permease protein
LAVAVCVLLGLSAHHTEMDKMLALVGQYAAYVVGLRKDSEVARGIGHYVSTALPLVLREETAVERVPDLDRAHLPLFSHLEVRESETATYDFAAARMITKTERHEFLVNPVGYLELVLREMFDTLELALWGTILGIGVGAPLAYLGTRGYTPNPLLYALARGFAGLLRAVPEVVGALMFLLAFGMGSIPGILALALHSGGFLGKFYADDVENADKGPQEALFAVGASRLKVLRYAVLPQVLPQYASYTQYILERNVRMATVLGVVGAGGIGVELKGRYDMNDFGHMTTILVVLLVTVIALEQLSQWARKRMM